MDHWGCTLGRSNVRAEFPVSVSGRASSLWRIFFLGFGSTWHLVRLWSERSFGAAFADQKSGFVIKMSTACR